MTTRTDVTVDTLEARANAARGPARVEALVDLARVLRSRDPRRALAVARQAHAAAMEEQECSQEDAVRALIALSICHRQLSEFDAALECAVSALELLGSDGDDELRAQALLQIGASRGARDEFEAALETLREGLVIQRSNDDRGPTTASLLNALGGVHHRRGDPTEALRFLEEASEIWRSIGDFVHEARIRNNMGIVYSHLGDYPAALEHLQQAASIHRKSGDVSSQAITLEAIATVHLHMDAIAEAVSFAEQSLGLRREIGDRRGEASGLLVLSEAVNSLGESDRDHPRPRAFRSEAP
jgi:tetratricopeptide (TPR) repeat protein